MGRISTSREAVMRKGSVRSTLTLHGGTITAANVAAAHERLCRGGCHGKIVLESFAST